MDIANVQWVQGDVVFQPGDLPQTFETARQVMQIALQAFRDACRDEERARQSGNLEGMGDALKRELEAFNQVVVLQSILLKVDRLAPNQGADVVFREALATIFAMGQPVR